MPQHLDQIPTLSPEDVEITGMRVAVQRFLNLQRKTGHPTPHIRQTGREPNANSRRRNNHRRSAAMTRRSVVNATSRPTLTDIPSGSVISIRPDGTDDPTEDAVRSDAHGGGTAVFRGASNACTGTNAGVSTARNIPARA